MQYSKQITERIRRVLEEDGREFEFDKDEGVFSFTLPLHDRCIDSLQYYIFVHDDRFILYAHPPFLADINDRPNILQLAILLLELNYGLYSGSFQLNFRNGMLRYRVYYECGSHNPSKDNIRVREALQAATYAFETFGCAIVGVLRFGMSANYAFKLSKSEQLKLAFFGDEPTVQKDTGASTESDSEAETESDKIAAQLDELFEALRGKPFEDDTSAGDAADNGAEDENLDTHLFNE